jgi:putative endonuclease
VPAYDLPDLACSERSGGDPRRSLGRLGERLAAAHLERRGLRVIARNVRTRHGEIDLIAFDGETLAFVEVKTRRSGGLGGRVPAGEPFAALHARKRARIRRLALAWLRDRKRDRPSAGTIRFDAIGVVVDRRDRLILLEHLEAAW